MTTKQFDPAKFIDRELEQELFEELLQLQDDTRILAIHDGGGMGKTQVLNLFQYRCRVASSPRIAVSFVTFGQSSTSTPFLFLKAISQHLDSFVPFTRFKQQLRNLDMGDFMSIRAAIHLEKAQFRDARDVSVAGIMFKETQAVHVSPGAFQLTPEQEKVGQEVCIKAFFEDLRAYCGENPVVLLLDAYEKCHDNLRHWFENHLLERHFFDCTSRPMKLLMVVAGRTVPRFDLRWAQSECVAVVKSINQLSKWNREHVEECLCVHGFRYEPKDVETFHRLIERGIAPAQVIQLMQTMDQFMHTMEWD